MYIRDRNRNLVESINNIQIDPTEQESLDESYNTMEEDHSDYGGIIDQDALLEAMFADAIACMDDDERERYFQSDEFNALVEANIIGNKVLRAESKEDYFSGHLSRMLKMAALQKAKEVGDALYDKLRKIRIQEKNILNSLYKRYSNSVRQDVMKADKRFRQLHNNGAKIRKDFNNITNDR